MAVTTNRGYKTKSVSTNFRGIKNVSEARFIQDFPRDYWVVSFSEVTTYKHEILTKLGGVRIGTVECVRGGDGNLTRRNIGVVGNNMNCGYAVVHNYALPKKLCDLELTRYNDDGLRMLYSGLEKSYWVGKLPEVQEDTFEKVDAKLLEVILQIAQENPHIGSIKIPGTNVEMTF